ncbi:unnamed protein product [Ectocarpus sp. CCAP 1310/34]|nr:unnamed protein product [Ectocarpus sp. CCAP 1310/34]
MSVVRHPGPAPSSSRGQAIVLHAPEKPGLNAGEHPFPLAVLGLTVLPDHLPDDQHRLLSGVRDGALGQLLLHVGSLLLHLGSLLLQLEDVFADGGDGGRRVTKLVLHATQKPSLNALELLLPLAILGLPGLFDYLPNGQHLKETVLAIGKMLDLPHLQLLGAAAEYLVHLRLLHGSRHVGVGSLLLELEDVFQGAQEVLTAKIYLKDNADALGSILLTVQNKIFTPRKLRIFCNLSCGVADLLQLARSQDLVLNRQEDRSERAGVVLEVDFGSGNLPDTLLHSRHLLSRDLTGRNKVMTPHKLQKVLYEMNERAEESTMVWGE